MVQGLKYRDRTDLAPWMARWMLRAGAELIAGADVVVPVPLHWRRFFSRRFNQSAELARAVATLAGKRFESGA
jgi:predicted amidophosphoribosyltransferase